jgi:hypothetical protein
MDFYAIQSAFERDVFGDGPFELLEEKHSPWFFGSGFAAYRANGRLLRMVWAGREGFLEVQADKVGLDYPQSKWMTAVICRGPRLGDEEIARARELFR